MRDGFDKIWSILEVFRDFLRVWRWRFRVWSFREETGLGEEW